MVHTLVERSARYAGMLTRQLMVDGDGPGFVLLHGFADSADTFRPVLARLDEAGVTAVAVDLPAFGRSPMPLDGRPGVADYDRFVAAVVERLADRIEQSVILVGHSMGGAFAVRAAEAQRRLPLDAVVALAPAGADLIWWLRRLIDLRRLLAVDRGPLQPNPAVIRRALMFSYRRLVFADYDAVDPTMADYHREHNLDPVMARERIRIVAGLHPEILDPWDPARIEVPVHVVGGTKDRLVRHQSAERIADSVGNGRFSLFEDVGHAAQIEAPDRVAELLLEEARAVSGRGREPRRSRRPGTRRTPPAR